MKKVLLMASLTAICMAKLSAQTLQVLSATVKDQKIAGAEVVLQRNGEQSQIGTTNASGQVTLNAPFADDASSLVIIKKPGYSTLVAKCPCNSLTYALSPVMNNLDAMRIVLSWGRQPKDIDAHLSYENNHVYYASKEGQGANLDVDDIDSYGPETITIEQRSSGSDYIFSVHDYSDRQNPQTYNLSNSGARIFVYVGESLVRTYYVPTNMKGNLWTVFRMSPDGQMYDINKMSSLYVESDALNFNTVSNAAQNGVYAPIASNSTEAVSNNSLGEQYYKNKDYANAIRYYQIALDQDPQYGQAYSNLGLAYKKANKYAEAIWSNRKAIEFGNNTTKANSYYNIGRIYEERRKYAEALAQYQAAKRNNPSNTAYENSIQRVKVAGHL
jgi:tetratricopeptide (TPR) repeat protein